MPRPAPRVAPATSAILPVNSFATSPVDIFATLPVDILASLPGDTLRTAMSLMGEGVAGGADVEGVRVDDGRGGGDVGLRDAVLPGEMVLVPEGPEVAEHHRCAGEHVAEAAPQELARVGERAVEADDGEAAKLHSRSGSRKSGEQEKILRIEQVKGSEIDDGVHFFEDDLAAQRAEEAEESGGGEREKESVEHAGSAAFGEIGDGHERGLRMRTIVEGGREVELGLDADFHALGLALARGRPLARAIAHFFIMEGELGREGQPGLMFTGLQTAAAGAVFEQASADFAAPFGLGGCGGGADGYRLM